MPEPEPEPELHLALGMDLGWLLLLKGLEVLAVELPVAEKPAEALERLGHGSEQGLSVQMGEPRRCSLGVGFAPVLAG